METIRHGDMLCGKVKTKKKGSKLTESKVLMTGSGGNDHSFDNGKFYKLEGDDFIVGYLKAKNTKLYHPEHGNGKGKLKWAKLPDGVWEIRRQVEYTQEGMRQVED